MNTLRTFTTGSGSAGQFHSLPALAEQGYPNLSRLPVSIRIVLESLLRNNDGLKVSDQDVQNLANYNAKDPGDFEIPFVVARIVLQDFTGVPLLVDLAAMRSAVHAMGKDANRIEPLVPVDLVVDHSVQVDYAGTGDALARNLELEFHRNRERYEFLKWGEQAFATFKVVPPGIGIVHQVNLEYLAQCVLCAPFEISNLKSQIYYPDTLVGTDSHTTMINGLGVVGWGVGGIEAEAGMLGQPVTFLVPQVVGVHLTNSPAAGVTATDLVLFVTEVLRQTKVVGKFVEFYGPGAKALSLPDRATLANMAPEYGATMGFFGIDEITTGYLSDTGRPPELCRTVENYYQAQGLWGIPTARDALDFSQIVDIDLAAVKPGVAGPKRPQDRIDLDALKARWAGLLSTPAPEGYHKQRVRSSAEALVTPPPLDHLVEEIPSFGHVFGAEVGLAAESNDDPFYPLWEVTVDSKGGIKDTISHGAVLIAAITSCTNTSNPSVMLAAGLLAQKANARGLTVKPSVKTSLGPGSRVVTDYLKQTGLQAELDRLGFQTVGYGCTTCIGNSGPLDPGIEEIVKAEDIIAAAVLSGNRNFEARVHQSIKANFLMSPPLVVAFAIAGTVDIDMASEPLGYGSDGHPVFLRDLWPSAAEIQAAMNASLKPEVFQRLYSGFADQNPRWNDIHSSTGNVYQWDRGSTYIQQPPFFDGFSPTPRDIVEIHGARPLAIFGDSVTTDHISPAGAIKPDSPAGRYLTEQGVACADFNSYGSRRGNDRVMTRGTFANVRIKNLMVPGSEGGVTKINGASATIYDAAMTYQKSNTPVIIIGGEDYGMGSSRDWAAKGTSLLGVRAVITKSFERIHRSNLVGMGVLPCTFVNKADYARIKDLADATFDLIGLSNDLKPQQQATLRVHPKECASGPPVLDIPVIVRIDTPVEKDYYRAGGILPYVLTQILG
jgi:aconitate hydratase